MEPEVLDTQILYRSGAILKIRRWYKGIHPTFGKITKGWSGWETVAEVDLIKPLHIFTVVDKRHNA